MTQTREVEVVNMNQEAVVAGDVVSVVQTLQGHLVTTSGAAGGGNDLLVELQGSSYAEGDDCESQEQVDASGGLRAKIILRPCGAGTVFGEEDGYITIYDEIGWLEGFSGGDINERRAFAHLMEDEYLGCKWVLNIPNMFRERQVLRDWYVSGTTIVEELENVHVWNHCRLPDEITVGTECPTEYGE